MEEITKLQLGSVLSGLEHISNSLNSVTAICMGNMKKEIELMQKKLTLKDSEIMSANSEK